MKEIISHEILSFPDPCSSSINVILVLMSKICELGSRCISEERVLPDYIDSLDDFIHDLLFNLDEII